MRELTSTYQSKERQEFVRLRNPIISRQIRRLDLRQWWIAEQLGVSKLTVLRWVGGKVRSTQRETAEKLAQIIRLPLDEIVELDGPEVSPSLVRASRENAASLVSKNFLLEACRKNGRWDFLQAASLGLASPDLPKEELGKLYCTTAHSYFFRYEFAEAIRWAERAIKILKGTKEYRKLLSGYFLRTHCYMALANAVEAGKSMTACLNLHDHLSPEDQFAVHGQHGHYLLFLGDWEAGTDLLGKLKNSSVFARADHQNQSYVLQRYASGLIWLQKVPEALSILEESVAVSQREGDLIGVHRALYLRIHAKLQVWDFGQTATLIKEFKSLGQRLNEPAFTWKSLEAPFLCQTENVKEGRQLFDELLEENRQSPRMYATILLLMVHSLQRQPQALRDKPLAELKEFYRQRQGFEKFGQWLEQTYG